MERVKNPSRSFSVFSVLFFWQLIVPLLLFSFLALLDGRSTTQPKRKEGRGDSALRREGRRAKNKRTNLEAVLGGRRRRSTIGGCRRRRPKSVTQSGRSVLGVRLRLKTILGAGAPLGVLAAPRLLLPPEALLGAVRRPLGPLPLVPLGECLRRSRRRLDTGGRTQREGKRQRERDLLAKRIPLSKTLEKQGPVPEVPCPYFQDGVLKAPFPVAHLPARRGSHIGP